METLQYIFTPTPTGQFDYYLLVLIICGILFVLSFFIPILYKKNKPLKILVNKFPGRIRISCILMLLYLGLRHENIPFLSMRFFFYLIILLFIYFILRYLYIYLRVYPKKKNFIIKNKPSGNKLSYNKYLPTPKKKKKKRR